MLRSKLAMGLMTQRSVLKYIGERFRLKTELPEWTSEEDVTRHLLKLALNATFVRLSIMF